MNEKAKPTHLDLFSGIGGFALAAQWAGFRTVAFCEIEPYCQKVLAKNFGAVFSDASRVFSGSEGKQRWWKDSRRCRPKLVADIRQLDGREFAGVDLITGGFPCQPFSVCGKRRGAADDRHLWSEMRRVVAQARPAWVLAENVFGIVSMELDEVLTDLERDGYAVGTLLVPACAVDAPHKRMRVWIVAHAEGADGLFAEHGRRRGQTHRCIAEPELGGVVDGLSNGMDEFAIWQIEPNIARITNEKENRTKRIKALGNAIVPQVAYEILKNIAAQIRRQQ